MSFFLKFRFVLFCLVLFCSVLLYSTPTSTFCGACPHFLFFGRELIQQSSFSFLAFDSDLQCGGTTCDDAAFAQHEFFVCLPVSVVVTILPRLHPHLHWFLRVVAHDFKVGSLQQQLHRPARNGGVWSVLWCACVHARARVSVDIPSIVNVQSTSFGVRGRINYTWSGGKPQEITRRAVQR